MDQTQITLNARLLVVVILNTIFATYVVAIIPKKA